MAYVTEEKLQEVATALKSLYDTPFRGKKRGRFALTRTQLKDALGVEKLHAATIEKLQDRALGKGLILVDLDDIFPCIETQIARAYRKPPRQVFEGFFPPTQGDPASTEDEDD